MELVGSTKDVHVIVQFARAGYDTSNGHWTGVRRYLVTHDTDPVNINSLRLDNPALGYSDMADWHVLRNFVDWGVHGFPADHYCLVLWDHGNGWQIRSAAVGPQFKYFLTDSTSGNVMHITDVPSALAGENIDVVAFDTCLMQEMEVAYELKNSANYMVGTAGPEPAAGYNYDTVLSNITSSTAPADLCRIIVNQYVTVYPPPTANITQSAFDLTKIDELAQALSGFAQALINNKSTYAGALASARNDALNYSTLDAGANSSSLDLIDYASRCSGAMGSDVQSAYMNLDNAFNDVLVAEAHNPDLPTAHGLGIYVPSPGSYDSRYGMLTIANDTIWADWIKAQTQ